MSDFEEILQPIAELLAKKNHDYGDSYSLLRAKYGPDSFLIRLSDKMNRLEILTKHESQVKTESIEDTIQDIIGYCTLELRYRRGNDARARAGNRATGLDGQAEGGR